MRKYFSLLTLLPVFLLSCGKSDAQQVQHVSPKQVHDRIKSDTSMMLLDVRTEEEYLDDGHIPDAYLIPLDELASRIGEVPKSKSIVIYCRSGRRSMQAAEILHQHGIDASSMDGGIAQWEEEGFEVEKAKK